MKVDKIKSDITVNTLYTPSLSSMIINITDDRIISNILDDLCELKHFEKKNKFDFAINEQLRIIYSNNVISIEHYETRPPHSRQMFYSQIEEIYNYLPTIKKIDITTICDTSWFSILWNPIKANKASYQNTSFIVYYSFNKEELNTIQIEIIGILPIKFNNKLFLTKIKKTGNNEIDESVMKKSIVIFIYIG